MGHTYFVLFDGIKEADVYTAVVSSGFGTTRLAVNTQTSDLFELVFPCRGLAII